MIEVKVINKIEDKVNEYINNTGSTKTWIAKQIGVAKQTLNTIMKSQNPTIETMVKLSVLFDCDISELYDTEIIRDGMIIKIHRVQGEMRLK